MAITAGYVVQKRHVERKRGTKKPNTPKKAITLMIVPSQEESRR